MPTIERPDPPYLQIASNLREKIVSGELSDGDPIPSARQITRDWGVAMATATKVLATLRSEGLVRALPGIGTVVTSRESLHAAAGDRSSSIARRGRIYPPGHYARILSSELTTAPDEVADALGLEAVYVPLRCGSHAVGPLVHALAVSKNERPRSHPRPPKNS